MNFKDVKQIIETLRVRRSIAKKTIEDSEEELLYVKENLELLEKFKNLVISASEKSIEEVLGYIEDTVTFALQSVFGKNYKAKIIYETKREQQEIRFILLKGDLELELRKDVTAVGEVDVYAYGLKMAFLGLEDNPLPIMAFDEPFKFLSKNYLPTMGNVVNTIGEELDLQQIIITHADQIMEIADANLIKIGE